MTALSTAISAAQTQNPTYALRKINLAKIIDATVMLAFATPLGFVINKIATYSQISGVNAHTKGDYILMLTSCLLGILAANVPSLIHRFLKIEIPTGLHVMFSAFLFCAIFLGEVASFYYLVPHWDDILHLGSGIMTGLFGLLLATNFCKTSCNISLPPVAVAIFAFCFAVCVGGVWEIFEFSMDSFLGLNMQKTLLQSGEMLMGKTAVADTMKDIVVDTCGAIIASAISYYSVKHPKINIS